jgi:hypothetical protein
VEAQLNRRELVSVWLVYGGVWLLGLLGLFAYSKLSASDVPAPTPTAFPAAITRTDDDSRRVLVHHGKVQVHRPGGADLRGPNQ